MLMEEAFDYLDAPVKRLASVDAPLPYAANLEKLALPKAQNIIDAVLEVCYKK
jgi:pyruvate dehydrogenase E1 component beta subunit